MADDIARKFAADSVQVGVDSFAPSVTPDLQLDTASFNVSTGINQGWGPRYGMATIPGHADTEANSGTAVNGLRKSETALGSGLIDRNKIFGVVPVSLGTYADPRVPSQHYIWLVGLNESTTTKADALLGGDLSGGIYRYQPAITNGIEKPAWKEATLLRNAATEMVFVKAGTSNDSDFQKVLESSLTRYYTPWAAMSVSGLDVPMRYLFGRSRSTPDATHAANLGLAGATQLTLTSPGTFRVEGGRPSQLAMRNFSDKARTTKFWALTATGNLNIEYSIPNFIPTTTEYVSTNFGYATANVDILLASTTAVKETSGTSYASTVVGLYYDDEMKCSSAYKAVFMALDRPVAVVFQEWQRDTIGHLQQYVDLTNPGIAPASVGKQNRQDSGATVTETIPTCFVAPPTYKADTATAVLDQFAVQGANSGVLRSTTTYELSFAYYNKRLNYETNVGAPMLFRTGASDFVSIQILCDSLNGWTVWKMQQVFDQLIPFDFSDTQQLNIGSGDIYMTGRDMNINHYEIRFYYRAYGTREWLPAGKFDAAEYWFKPHRTGSMRLCSGPIAGLPGGEPGGFIDYSPLPRDQYNCVLTYKNRVWWFSPKQINFSLPNNGFAYPTSNSIAAQAGTYRGGIVHIQPGETVQTSRLVIFASEQSYVARFTGIRRQQPVQVSPDVTATFDVDGSDLEVDYLTDATAYSHRAACVADGILYFWGPQGVYRDDGISEPKKVSLAIEPFIFELVDPAHIDEVHCTYSKETEEIVWFYRPKTTDSYETHGLVLNTITGEFFPARFKGKIDATQTLRIENDSSPTGTSGLRTIAYGRETGSSTVQRAYFFDPRCRSGDMYPTADMVVKTVATPVAGQRRLTLASGFDATKFATIAVGDYITLQQTLKYASGMTAASDMIAKVAAVNASGYIDVTIPSTASIDAAASPSQTQYFPIWHRSAAGAGLNGFAWRWKTGYWAPGGVNFHGIWIYLYLFFKLNRYPSVDDQNIALSHRAMQSADFSPVNFALVDNCDGNMQLYKGLSLGDVSVSGQAIKFMLEGYHIGSEWVVQYLEAHANIEQGNVLKTFEG